MRQPELLRRSVAALRRWPRLIPVLLLGLNAGFFAWSQGAFSGAGMANVSAQERPDADFLAQGIRLLSVQEGLQIQNRVQLQARQAQAEAAAREQDQQKAQEFEMVLEFEPPPKPTVASRASGKPNQSQPIVRLRVRNPRH